MSDNGTIAAVSSPPGGGARGIIRLSGPSSSEIISRVVDRVPAGRGVHRVQMQLPGKLALPALLYCMPGPHSYTGEDVIEIHLPGSPPVLRLLMDTVIKAGATPAGPGEFTQRAYLNRRMDLTQAEAVQSIIHARNLEEVRAARHLLEGGFSSPLSEMEEGLLDLCADVEASIDFVDQDIELIPEKEIFTRLSAIQSAVAGLLSQSYLESTLQPVVALYGLPNAGKSTLFNRLTGEKAMVSERPGTTRDFLSGEMDSIRILDLAGDQESSGVDQQAVLRSRQIREEADLVLCVVDASAPERAAHLELGGRPVILVFNKIDLEEGEGEAGLFQGRRFVDRIRVSAKTGAGIEDLRALLRGRVLSEVRDPSSRFHVTIRQYAFLQQSVVALEEARKVLQEGKPVELVALDLRAASECLGSISGRHVSEEILDRIFSRFCLGK